MKEHGLKHFRVLVADDDSSILDLFRQVLSRVKTDHIVQLEPKGSKGKLSCQNTPNLPSQSFEITTCQQGDEAVDAVKKSLKENKPFSAAFIDVQMPPGPDGIRTAEHIRALDPNIEIVIVTGYSDTHPRDIARRVPPAHKLLYLQKPFHIQEIYQFASALSMKWHTELELQRVNKGLERSVEARIQEFKKVNEELQIKFIELQQTQLALQKSEDKLNAMLLSVPDHISMMDKDLNIIWANDTDKKIFGERIIGKKCYEVYRRGKEPCEPYPCLTLKAFQNGQTHAHETQVIDKEGNELSFYCTANVALRDENGSPTAVIKVSRDITEQKQSQKSLQESEERFRMIFTNSTDGIIVADPATKKFTCVNPAICKALDYTKEELTQMSVVDIHPKNSLEHVVSEFEAQARGEKLLAMNLPFLKKDGTIIYMDVNASIVKIGGKHRVMGIFRDITERVKAEEALKKSHNELECRVEDRTRKLRTTLNTMKRKEKEIIQHKSSLEKVNREIMETNQALSVLARNIDRDKELLEKKIYETTSVNIMPIIKELQNDRNCQKHQAELEVLTAYLNGLISGPTDHHDIIISLTDQEMRVAVMIKNDMTSQKIANMLYISLHTVKTHRKNIRKKLNIQNSNINLCSYLRSKMVSDKMS